tara:strand:- start:386 stop:868 length:483 start_codon:yes stop_codon:yes gene_type:complete
MFKTHAIFGLFLALLTFNYFQELNIYLFTLITVFSAILLDIDEKHSKIGYKTRPLSNIIQFIFKHRGFIHSIFFIAIISFLINTFFGNYYIPFLIGSGSHILLDALTPRGIRLFYPFQFKMSFFFKTRGIVDQSLFFILTASVLLIKFPVLKSFLLKILT